LPLIRAVSPLFSAALISTKISRLQRLAITRLMNFELCSAPKAYSIAA
jgi:hypothetical protein